MIVCVVWGGLVLNAQLSADRNLEERQSARALSVLSFYLGTLYHSTFFFTFVPRYLLGTLTEHRQKPKKPAIFQLCPDP